MPDFEITIFGDETHVNYNRILLSMVLAGEKSADEIILNDIEWYRANNIHTRLGVQISGIDRAARTVVDDQDGRRRHYDKLILAMGSSAFIPPIPGVDKENVHVFRTLDDTQALLGKGAQRAEDRGHRRRFAGARSGARAAGARLRCHGDSPDGFADGAPAGRHRRRISEAPHREAWASA